MRIMDQKISLKDEGAFLETSYKLSGKVIELGTNVFGLQHSYNVGYAFLAAKHYGIADDAIEDALLHFVPIAGRGICKKLPGNIWVIDEAYNANPSSMKAALENALDIAEGSSLSAYGILGGMRELGSSSSFWHRQILEMAPAFSRLVLLGEEWFDPEIVLPKNAQRYLAFEEITPFAQDLAGSDSIILVKGSNSYGLKRFVALLTEG